MLNRLLLVEKERENCLSGGNCATDAEDLFVKGFATSQLERELVLSDLAEFGSVVGRFTNVSVHTKGVSEGFAASVRIRCVQE